MNPKMNRKTFILYFDDNYFKKGDILDSGTSYQVKVIKVYKYNLFRRLLFKWFNIPFKMYNCVKVKDI